MLTRYPATSFLPTAGIQRIACCNQDAGETNGIADDVNVTVGERDDVIMTLWSSGLGLSTPAVERGLTVPLALGLALYVVLRAIRVLGVLVALTVTRLGIGAATSMPTVL